MGPRVEAESRSSEQPVALSRAPASTFAVQGSVSSGHAPLTVRASSGGETERPAQRSALPEPRSVSVLDMHCH